MDDLTLQSREHVLILKKAFRYVDAADAASQVPLDVKRAPIAAFYEDLVHFEDAWYSKIFSPEGDPTYACMAVATLVIFAEVFYRQRDKISRAIKIMKHAMQILECHRVQTYGRIPRHGERQIKNFRQVSFQAHGTWQNLNLQLGNQKEAVTSCRWLMNHELDENVLFERRVFLPLIYRCFEPSMTRTLTKEQVQNIDDTMIWAQLNKTLDIIARTPKERGGIGDYRIRTCAACGKREKRLRSMKRCGKCHASFYCSTDCQRLDWPTHKQSCMAAEVVAPMTGPFDWVEGSIRPDGKKILFKVFRDPK